MFGAFTSENKLPVFNKINGVNWREKLPIFLDMSRAYIEDVITSLLNADLLTLSINDPEFGVVACISDINAELASELGISELDALANNDTNPSERILLLLNHITRNCGELTGTLPATLYQHLLPILREVINEKYQTLSIEV